jgi:hypothetical protein
MKSRIVLLAAVLALPMMAQAQSARVKSCIYNPETGVTACTSLPPGCSIDQEARAVICIPGASAPAVAGVVTFCTKGGGGGGGAVCTGLAPASCRITLTYDANAPATVRREDAAPCDQAADEAALILFLKRSIAGESAQ